MNKLFYTLIFIFSGVLLLQAGNPDRQGEAGAYELVMNPWPVSAGLHGMLASRVSGIDAMRINVAGLRTINKTELAFARTTYLQGTDIYMNAIGFGQRVGDGVIGVSLMSLDFGDIAVTTTDQPEGVGATYSPSFFNLGLAYTHTFDKKISVGTVVRVVSESTTNVSAQGVAIDAGIQYVTGEEDNFRFGISLRNIGTPMQFSGEGLSFIGASPDGSFNQTINQRSARFELPSQLHIGASYDFLFAGENRLSAIGNFTSNSFGRDYLGGGLEYSFREMFTVRGGYRYETGGTIDVADESVYTGLSAGASLQVPLNKKKSTKFAVDYAYRATNPWQGTHNIGVRLTL